MSLWLYCGGGAAAALRYTNPPGQTHKHIGVSLTSRDTRRWREKGKVGGGDLCVTAAETYLSLQQA